MISACYYCLAIILLDLVLLGDSTKDGGTAAHEGRELIQSPKAAAPPAPATRDDFRVRGLEDIEPAFASFTQHGAMYAGALPVNISVLDHGTDDDTDMEGHLMFWLFLPNTPMVDDTLVLWMNGGPGCSTFHAGLFFELGPVISEHYLPAGYYAGLNESNAPLRPNPYSWTNATSILFVDQPVGVGYSYGGRVPQNETDIAQDMYGFLQAFYRIFPEQRAQRLFVAGESYAGYYVPAIAHYIHQRNKELVGGKAAQQQQDKRHQPEERSMNLAGIALGNGWIDATIQGPMVIDFAWWHGMIDSVTRDALHEEWKNCYLKPADPFTAKQPLPFHSFTVPDECGIMEALLLAAGNGLVEWGGPNIYDVTTWDPYSLISALSSTHTRFFNDPRVREALHAPKHNKVWLACIADAGGRQRRRQRRTSGAAVIHDDLQQQQADADSSKRDFSYTSAREGDSTRRRGRQLILDRDQPISVVPYIAELLDDAGIQVLIYSGDRDLSTCVQGSEAALNGMKWRGSSAWVNPYEYHRGLWLVDNYTAGYAKRVNNLEFVVVYNSGHLVPTNQPANALDLIQRLLTGRTFVDKEIPFIFDNPQQPRRHDGVPRKSSGTHGILDFGKLNSVHVGLVIFVSLLSFLLGLGASTLIARFSKRSQYARLNMNEQD